MTPTITQTQPLGPYFDFSQSPWNGYRRLLLLHRIWITLPCEQRWLTLTLLLLPWKMLFGAFKRQCFPRGQCKWIRQRPRCIKIRANMIRVCRSESLNGQLRSIKVLPSSLAAVHCARTSMILDGELMVWPLRCAPAAAHLGSSVSAHLSAQLLFKYGDTSMNRLIK